MNVKSSKKKVEDSSAATTGRWAVVCLLLLFGYSIDSLADCPSPVAPSGFADNVREFYEDMCRESDAPLVLASNPSVKSRLQLPSGGHRLTEDEIYPDNARRLSFEGSVVVAFAVELDGTVKHAKIIQSSGHQSLDDAEWMYWKQYRFDNPGQLDGEPVRTIVLERMNFKLKGGSGLPPSFSDWAVDNLGFRILQPYSRRDANALFQGIDETAKTSINLPKIQERITRYTKQFGAMSYVSYKGLLSVKNVGGVPQYRLWYLVRATAPESGAAALIVTAVDRRPLPGITDFEFEQSPIRLNIH
jgi:TonB family protein